MCRRAHAHTHGQSNCCPHRNISVIRQRWIRIDPSGQAAENLLRVTATSAAPDTRVKTFHYCRLCFSPNDKIRPLWRSITSAIIPEKGGGGKRWWWWWEGEIKCWVYRPHENQWQVSVFYRGGSAHGSVGWLTARHALSITDNALLAVVFRN